MDLPPGFRITTEILWQGALGFAILDALLVPLVVWLTPPGSFRRLGKILVAVAGLFWAGMWLWMVTGFWQPVYRYVFPAGLRWWLPLFMAVLEMAANWVMWRLAARSSRHPAIVFCALSGLWGMLTHLWAVDRGIVSQPPLLQGASPVAAVVIAVFEFTFYGCLILLLSRLAQGMGSREKGNV